MLSHATTPANDPRQRRTETDLSADPNGDDENALPLQVRKRGGCVRAIAAGGLKPQCGHNMEYAGTTDQYAPSMGHHVGGHIARCVSRGNA